MMFNQLERKPSDLTAHVVGRIFGYDANLDVGTIYRIFTPIYKFVKSRVLNHS